jgi:hypothetical protein
VEAIALEPVDALRITTLGDNVTDLLLRLSTLNYFKVVDSGGPVAVVGAVPDLCATDARGVPISALVERSTGWERLGATERSASACPS